MNFSILSFGYFAIKIFGILLTIAFAVSVFHYYRQVQKKKLSVDFFVHHFWKWLVGGMIGGRVLALMLEPEIVFRHGWLSPVAFWDGEFHFFGMLAAFLACMAVDLRRHQKHMWTWIDSGIFSALLGIMIIDVAAFLTGTMYGIPTSLPWGVQYETFGVEILRPVHPVTLYAFAAHGWLLYWVKNNQARFEKFTGRLAIRTGIIFFSIDFFLQFLRGDQTVMLSIFRIEQLFDVLIVGVLVWLVWRRKSMNK